MKKVIFVAYALALVAITLPAFAQMGPGPDDREGPPRMHDGEKEHGMIFNPERLKKKLDLSDDQVAKIEDINKKYFTAHKGINDRIKPKADDLKKLLKEDAIDINKVRSLINDIATLQAESRVLMIQQYIEFESVLTPEQKQKARKAKDQMVDHGFGKQPPRRD